MKRQTVVLIPGDGIGPEVSSAVQQILASAGANIEWVERHAGVVALEREATVMPESTLAAIIDHEVALKGPCTTPVGKGFSSVNVLLRKKLNLYAAVRPVRSLPGVKTRFEHVDLVIIRENTEGLYSGIENEITPGVVTSLKVATDKACERIARWAFAYAVERNRREVTVMHKANIMKLTDGLFIRKASEVHKAEFPGVGYREIIIDAGCMRLVQDPSQFDMLLLENLYGDIVSDLCAGLVGGLGLAPGANIGEKGATFEAVHGSAPDIAGKNIANPIALILSGALLLDYIGELEAGNRVRAAVADVLKEGKHMPRDLGGTASTSELEEAIATRISG